MKLDGGGVALFILTTVGMVLVYCDASTSSGPKAQTATSSLMVVTTGGYEEPANTTRLDSAHSATTTVKSPHVSRNTSISAQRQECFQAANLTQKFTNFTCDVDLLVHYSLMEFWAHHASVPMCQKREAYGEVIGCVLDATMGCLPERNRVHFPDKTKAREGLRYICDVSKAKQFNVNMTCGQTHFPKVFDCIYRDTLLEVRSASLPAHIDPKLICRTYEIADLCCWEQLQVCGTDTAAAYTRLMSQYLRPPSCSAAAITVAFSLLALVFALVASLKVVL
ncbi:uncharacterized protein [Littorina saxatilis]|uniref:Uncharacterized protein n=1 Tax=Littorina saxatilis TaxID=31220 RepID=A0AAN9C071_9CAEN